MKARRLPLDVEIIEIPFDCFIQVGEKLEKALKGDYLLTNSLGETYPVRRDLCLAQYEILKEKENGKYF